MSTEKQKTEHTPKADPQFAASFASFDPMTYWTQTQQAFGKLVTENLARAQTLAEQFAALETQMIARAQGAVATWAQLAQDAIAYGAQLSAEARKLSMDAARNVTKPAA